MTKFASVITELNIDKTLDYSIPHEMVSHIFPGMRVEVPIRGRPQPAYVVEIKDSTAFKALPIQRLLSNGELITPQLFKLALWMSKYYCTSLSQVFKTILPASVRKETKHKEQLFVMRAKTKDELAEYCISIRSKHPAQAAILDVMLQANKGMLLSELLEEADVSRSAVDTLAKHGYLKVDIVRIDRSPLVNEDYFKTKPKTLNADQADALSKIVASQQAQQFATHLLFGVTGSGKTEVYLQAIDKALSMGKGTIMLVPEISLTAQTIERFRSRFEGHIAILHHRLSHGERFDEWNRIRDGKASIVIGARSAIFSPVKNLGLIIVDEEHELTYKQSDDMPCYHARDVAVMRGKMESATVVLGSATPSLESYYNATNNKYILSELKGRAETTSLPQVTIVDMAKEFEKAKRITTFSDALLSGIEKRSAKGEQTILFLNRRGYHSSLFCLPCQAPIKCQHCDVALTFHKGDHILACHLCGYQIAPPSACPTCKTDAPLKFRGVGTELVEKSLHAIFPDIRTIRVDADTTKHKGSHQKLLRDFGSGKADVLIGTQMIAKGLHFPQVTLVGVLNADTSINIPDFRASETVFQLITQVSGRSGRGDLQGEVIIQTSMPDNGTILLAAKQDYTSFYHTEIEVRKDFGYPPYGQLAKFSFSGEDQKKTYQEAEDVRNLMVSHLPGDFDVNPVVPCGHAKVKDKFRFQFLIRGPSAGPICTAVASLKIKGKIDIGPASTFF